MAIFSDVEPGAVFKYSFQCETSKDTVGNTSLCSTDSGAVATADSFAFTGALTSSSTLVLGETTSDDPYSVRMFLRTGISILFGLIPLTRLNSSLSSLYGLALASASAIFSFISFLFFSINSFSALIPARPWAKISSNGFTSFLISLSGLPPSLSPSSNRALLFSISANFLRHPSCFASVTSQQRSNWSLRFIRVSNSPSIGLSFSSKSPINLSAILSLSFVRVFILLSTSSRFD